MCKPLMSKFFPAARLSFVMRASLARTKSVIGRDIEPIIKRFMTNQPQKFEVAKARGTSARGAFGN